MEQALKESERRLSQVFYLLPDLVTISSLDEGRFVDMNHQWEAMMGFTRDEAVGRPTADLDIWVHAEQRLRLIEDVKRDGMVRSREIAVRRKDGREMDCETSASIFDWQGQRLLLLVTRDVTAQKELERARAAAEASLRESEEKFSKAFHSSPDYMTISRLSDGIILD
jgi:PAS domain S-box-containing protein